MTADPSLTAPVRSAGLLLHPTSLPGPYGIGDLGPSAYAWVDFLAQARQTWWQVLPLGPTGYGDSPYQSFSSFAGNLKLLSPDLLVRDGLVAAADLGATSLAEEHVEFDRVQEFKARMLRTAWENFQAGAAGLRPAFAEFCAAQAGWLDDYALFMALKDRHGAATWQDWPRDVLRREPAALALARQQLGDVIGTCQFGQFLFFRQWQALRDYAHGRGIRLIGDVPIFVAGDSADVWSHPELFLLDAERRPAVVAGVPPDYFSATGQLWGNPLYDWPAHRRSGYAWWAARLRAVLALVDRVRIDHFRGFEAYWEIPAGRPTAEVGRWVPGPGAEFFTALGQQLGSLPLIAEDLGLITPDVVALRDQLSLPGMRVLQFAFSGPDNTYLPHHHVRHSVVYTGTHDNDTTAGWFAALEPEEARFVRRYAPGVERDPAGVLLRLAWGSVADDAIAPLQDVLGLGSAGRMNRPGKPEGNWRWRFRAAALTPAVADRLAEITELFGRASAG